MNILCIAGLAMLLAGVNAQAVQPARSDPHAASAMMLDAARAGARIVTVGEHGYVLLSDDDGKTSRQARSVPSNLALTAVSFTDARHGWAVGHGGVIVHTEDGGESWRLQREDSAVDQPLLTVYFRDVRTGWAAGLWGLLLATRDGGATWLPVQLPAPEGSKHADVNLLKLFPGTGGQLYIAAERGVVFGSGDDGASWKVLPTGSKASLWSGTATAGGALLVGGLGGRVLRSTDAGASWNAVDAGTTASITHLRAESNGIVASALDGRLLHSRDDGKTWQADAAGGEPVTAIVARADGGYLRYSRHGLLK